MDTNDYSNNYVHTGVMPTKYVRNVARPFEGYPKLQKLRELKKAQITKHAVKPYGCRVETHRLVPTLNNWCNNHNLQFETIMIGALQDNQFIFPLLTQLPLNKLCSRPGFLFIWATKDNIAQLSRLLNTCYNKKFRRSEELVFVALDKKSPFYPTQNGTSLTENQQWHCWMCITGTVRRSFDAHLIHCNVDTDLQFEDPSGNNNRIMPESMYRVAENFSNATRRLHIIPSKANHTIRMRPGWVIMGPDVMLNNFDPAKYDAEVYAKSSISYKNGQTQYLVSQTSQIDDLRPKSPAKNS